MNKDITAIAQHLVLVQGVINRMARNCNDLKTASLLVSFITSLLLTWADDLHWMIALGGCLAIAIFWSLDARYLQIERAYVKLHADIAKPDSKVKAYDLNVRTYLVQVDSVWRTAWSWSVCHFYISEFIFVGLICAATVLAG